MESLKKNALDSLCNLGMFFIAINIVSLNNIWVLDTRCGSHICTDMQGLRNSRKLNKGELDLRVGNGARVSTLDLIHTYVCGLMSTHAKGGFIYFIT